MQMHQKILTQVKFCALSVEDTSGENVTKIGTNVLLRERSLLESKEMQQLQQFV